MVTFGFLMHIYIYFLLSCKCYLIHQSVINLGDLQCGEGPGETEAGLPTEDEEGNQALHHHPWYGGPQEG